MQLNVRRTLTVVDQVREVARRRVAPPLRRVATVWVIENPFVDRFVEDLSPLVEASIGLGRDMAEAAVAALDGVPVQSYGKAGLVGLRGEQEHANALLTTVFANPMRDAIGGAQAWISSMTKVVSPGGLIDVPMNHKDDVYVRSHYDGMSLALPGIPMPDEIAVIFCLATGARPNARVGGLTHEEVMQRLGEKASR